MNGTGAAAAHDLLDSVFRVATELVRSERASLMLRDDATEEFVIANAVGLSEEVCRTVRVREGEGISGLVAASKRSVLVRGAEGSSAGGDGRYRTSSFLSVPIIVGDESRGVLNVADRSDGRPFEESDLETLELLAGHIGTCLLQQEQGEALARLAETDPLTQLFNRRHFDRRLEAESNRATRADQLLAVLMIGIDDQQSITDRFGHAVGDQAIRTVATAITQAVRLYDVPARYASDLFAVILPEADTEMASRVARRLLDQVAAQPLPPVLVAAGLALSVSIGVATYPRPLAEVRGLLEAATAAMDRAAQAGGGVRVWEHAFAQGPQRAVRPPGGDAMPPAPYLADPARLATPELQAHLPSAMAAQWNVLVVGREGHVLTVAFPDADPTAVDALSKASGFAIYPVYSSAPDLEATRRRLTVA